MSLVSDFKTNIQASTLDHEFKAFIVNAYAYTASLLPDASSVLYVFAPTVETLNVYEDSLIRGELIDHMQDSAVLAIMQLSSNNTPVGYITHLFYLLDKCLLFATDPVDVEPIYKMYFACSVLLYTAVSGTQLPAQLVSDETHTTVCAYFQQISSAVEKIYVSIINKSLETKLTESNL